MRKMRKPRHGSGLSDFDRQGLGALGESREELVGRQATDVQLEPPPGAPIRTAWIAGRIGLAFVDDGFAIRELDVDERPFLWDLED